MKITNEWLKEKNACPDGVKWFNSQKETNDIKVLKALIKDEKMEWANWLIVRVMSYKQYVCYAVFAAEQVIDLYVKKYPDDKRPRIAIKMAKKCIKNPSKNNRRAAADAADAAYATGAAYAAVYAAYAAANSAAYSAAYAAVYAAYAAANSAYKIRIKILNYGLSLLKSEG